MKFEDKLLWRTAIAMAVDLRKSSDDDPSMVLFDYMSKVSNFAGEPERIWNKTFEDEENARRTQNRHSKSRN